MPVAVPAGRAAVRRLRRCRARADLLLARRGRQPGAVQPPQGPAPPQTLRGRRTRRQRSGPPARSLSRRARQFEPLDRRARVGARRQARSGARRDPGGIRVQPAARSNKGAMGLMQLMPATAAELRRHQPVRSRAEHPRRRRLSQEPAHAVLAQRGAGARRLQRRARRRCRSTAARCRRTAKRATTSRASRAPPATDAGHPARRLPVRSKSSTAAKSRASRTSLRAKATPLSRRHQLVRTQPFSSHSASNLHPDVIYP